MTPERVSRLHHSSLLLLAGITICVVLGFGSRILASASINLGMSRLVMPAQATSGEDALAALKAVERAEIIHPPLRDASRQTLRKVQAVLARGPSGSARSLIASIPSTSPERRLVLTLVGDRLWSEQSPENAIDAWQESEAQLRLVILGEYAFGRGEIELAIRAWQAAQRIWQQRGQIRWYEEQEATTAYYSLARIWTEQGNLDAAIQEYIALSSLLPKNAASYWQAGELYRLKGDHLRAEEWLQRARALAPEHHRPYYHLGLLAADLDRWPEAVGWQQQAVARLGALERPNVFGELGRACQASGDLVCSRAAYETAIAQFPQSVDYRLALAQLCELSGCISVAREQYKQILQLEPENSQALDGLRMLERD